ncbi:MAG: YaaR family protein [Spirochaetales bacterium]|nr:YaaR family protein [Spirochaetales bacterium]
MERISGDGFFSYRREVQNDSKAGKRTRRTGKRRSFFSELGNLAESSEVESIDRTPEQSDAEAAELLDSVFESGDNLKRHTDLASLRAYKDAVRRFLSVVVKRGIDVEQQQSGADVLKRKRYALIRIIDDKLERLAAAMISNQRNQIELLAKIDEINGLIVDLRR